MNNCKDCGVEIFTRNSLVNRCYDCQKYKTKPLRKIGKRANEYNNWRKKTAYPLLYQRQSGKCADTLQILQYGDGDIHHIIGRNVRPDLKMNMDNVVLLSREAHMRRHNQIK